MKVFFDGACRPNPGAMQVAVVARGQLYLRDAGDGTSEAAEWLALLEGLAVARTLGLGAVELLGDSLSVVNQANGRSAARTLESKRCLSAFLDAAGELHTVKVRHVKRTQNLAGIALTRLHER
jgi:ribonuclease HI